MAAAPVAYVVQADLWLGPANVQGSVFIRRGTLVSISPDNAAMLAMYNNPVPLSPTGDGSDQDRSAQGN